MNDSTVAQPALLVMTTTRAQAKSTKTASPEPNRDKKRKDQPSEDNLPKPKRVEKEKGEPAKPAHSQPETHALQPKTQDAANTDQQIVEKGILYFFFRPKVEIESPSSIDEVQRGFIVLRPFEGDSILPEGALKDVSNLRLLVLPKKSLPKKGERSL